MTVGGRTYPVHVVARSAGRVELEIGGERVVVDGWPEGEPTPSRSVSVDGESVEARVEVDLAGGPLLSVPSASSVPVAGGPTQPPTGEGIPVAPPMPGRVVELRVQDGDRVEKGAVLLVLEAMKMRTEVTSPVAGLVRGVRVAAGSNARAREPMLFIAPA